MLILEGGPVNYRAEERCRKTCELAKPSPIDSQKNLCKLIPAGAQLWLL